MLYLFLQKEQVKGTYIPFQCIRTLILEEQLLQQYPIRMRIQGLAFGIDWANHVRTDLDDC